MLAIYGGPRVHENLELGCASGDCQGSDHLASAPGAPSRDISDNAEGCPFHHPGHGNRKISPHRTF